MASGSAQRPATVLHTESSVGFGGQEMRIIAESRWLIAHGWPATIVGQPGARLLAEAERASVPALAVRMRGAWDLAAVAALRRLIRAHDVGLVHTHSSVDAWVAGLAARSLAIPIVRSRHVTIPIPRRRALVYRLADRVITSGEAVAAIVRGAGVPADRVVAIGPGLETARFPPNVPGARRGHPGGGHPRGRPPRADPWRRDGPPGAARRRRRAGRRHPRCPARSRPGALAGAPRPGPGARAALDGRGDGADAGRVRRRGRRRGGSLTI